MQNLIKLFTILILFSVFAAPVFAQDQAEATTTAADDLEGTEVILPGQGFENGEGLEPTTEDPEESDPTPEFDVNSTFISGLLAGAAAGFVGGALTAWFLKPSKQE